MALHQTLTEILRGSSGSVLAGLNVITDRTAARYMRCTLNRTMPRPFQRSSPYKLALCVARMRRTRVCTLCQVAWLQPSSIFGPLSLHLRHLPMFMAVKRRLRHSLPPLHRQCLGLHFFNHFSVELDTITDLKNVKYHMDTALLCLYLLA